MSDKQQHHVLPLSTYLSVGGALLVLTLITVWVAQYQLGEWNLIVAMAVAATKATLVLLFFMHLKYDNKMYAFTFLIAVVFLAIFIVFTMLDTMTRDEFGRGSIDRQVQYKSAPAHGGEAANHGGTSADSVKVGHTADSVKTEPRK
jgi:cytochrome c oxidase subunit IV